MVEITDEILEIANRASDLNQQYWDALGELERAIGFDIDFPGEFPVFDDKAEFAEWLESVKESGSEHDDDDELCECGRQADDCTQGECDCGGCHDNDEDCEAMKERLGIDDDESEDDDATE